MDRLISFLVLLPFIVYFIIPAFMLVAFYIKKSDLSKSLVKAWSITFSIFSILGTFALMVVASQADLAFNNGRLFLTEPLVQLSLSSQIFGLFLIRGVFKNVNNNFWFYDIIKAMVSVGLLTYLIFSNQFLSVFLCLVAVLALAPNIQLKFKQIFTGLIISLLIALNFLDLEFSKSFSEIRLTQLSGEVNTWIGVSLVVLSLIFMLLTTLFVVSKDEKINGFNFSLWTLLSPIALIVCFYRMIQVGFISVDNITYNFSQWFLVFYMFLFLLVTYLKRFNLKNLILSFTAIHTTVAMLFSISGADDFSLSLSTVHFYVVSSIILLFVHFGLQKFENLKGAEFELSDFKVLFTRSKSYALITLVLALFASALPPGPLFIVAFTGERSLIDSGLYWSCVWSLIGLMILGYFLFSSFVNGSDVEASEVKEELALWSADESSIDLDFKEVAYMLAGFICLYLVAFLNL